MVPLLPQGGSHLGRSALRRKVGQSRTGFRGEEVMGRDEGR